MQITVFGAAGKVGQQVVARLLADGHEVTVFVHRTSPFAEHPQLNIVRGDVHAAADVAWAIQGSQAVICALGSWGTKSKDIVSSGTANIIPAMQAAGLRRLVTLTGADARASGDKLGVMHRITHALIQLTPARRILADGERHIRLLEASRLDWTALRSPVMRTFSARRYDLSAKRPLPWASVHRSAVAGCLVEQINRDEYSQQAPFIAAA